MKRLIFAALLIPCQALALARPGFLKPNYPVPTGHFNYADLEEHTTAYDEYEWLWVSDNRGNQGWVLKSDVMLPLSFSRKAQMLKNHVIYRSPSHSERTRLRLKQKQIVELIDRRREWFQIRYKVDGKFYYGWVRDEHLRSSTKDAGYFIATQDYDLKRNPFKQAKPVTTVAAEQRLLPVKMKGDWVLVQTSDKKRGFIPIALTKTRIDVAIKIRTSMGYKEPHRKYLRSKIYEIFAHPLWVGTGNYTLEVKAKPDMSSQTVVVVQPWSDLNLQGYARQRWGLSKLPRIGKVWWPADFTESNVPIPNLYGEKKYRLAEELIMQKVKSPLIRGLRFAATQKGVYKSVDGKLWRQMEQFDRGYPLNIDPKGTLFVGDKVSFDHGESFHEFIRWDKILTLLPIGKNFSHSPIRIIKISPEPYNLNKISLHIQVGYYETFELRTEDFGQTWALM